MKKAIIKIALLLVCFPLMVVAENPSGNLFDQKPQLASAPKVSSLTAKFARSKSAEKFNAMPNEKISYVGEDPEEHAVPLDKTPAVRVNHDAPSSFVMMKKAYDEGDLPTANAFADQYVRYMQRVIFEVRELSQMIGEAMVRKGQIDEEDWVGASQTMGREMARDHITQKVGFKATAEVSLERVQPDKNGKAEVYVFCSVNSSYCREMGPAIERVYRLTKNDNSIKFGVFVIGQGQTEYLKDFKTYTGLTMPIQDGNELAKKFRVSLVPAVVVRAPSENKAYLRTGLIPFPRFYEFVKTVQGQPDNMTDAQMTAVSQPIGMAENNPQDSASTTSSSFNTPDVVEASAGISAASERLQRF